MSGNFGYELDLMKQSADNLRLMQEQINFYKAHRQLLQFGEFYRLQAPDTQFASAWLFKNDQEALLIYSNGLVQPAVPIHYLKTVYLDSDAIYQDTETENCYSGAELNQAGILIPRIKQDFETAVYHWKKL